MLPRLTAKVQRPHRHILVSGTLATGRTDGWGPLAEQADRWLAEQCWLRHPSGAVRERPLLPSSSGYGGTATTVRPRVVMRGRTVLAAASVRGRCPNRATFGSRTARAALVERVMAGRRPQSDRGL